MATTLCSAAVPREWTAIASTRNATRPATSCSRETEIVPPSEQRSRLRPRDKAATKAKTKEPQAEDHATKDTQLFQPVARIQPLSHRQDATHRVASLLASAQQKLCEQLLIASEKGKKHAVYLLLHQGVGDRDRCRGMRGYSPLHHAAARGHLDVLQLFVDFGWSVDGRNDDFETPLHLASYGGHVAVVEFLLDKGADVNALARDNETPLFFAARKHHYRVVRLLLRRECDLTITNRFGDVAEDEATSDKTIQEFVTGREDMARLYTRPSHAPPRRVQFRGEVTLTQKLREDVLAFLDLTSLCRASQTCYRWHRASDTPSLWRRLGVSRWELQLQTSVGMGAVAPMTLLGGSSGRLQLSTAGLVGSVRKIQNQRRPASCDPFLASGANSISRFLGEPRRPLTARRPGF